MEQGALLYEGKAKKVFATQNPDQVIKYFKDDATAFNAQKRGTIFEKGIVNNKISTRLFNLLNEAGIPTHFLKELSDREMLAKHVSIVLLEVVVRNRATGSLVKRLGLEDGMVLDPPLLEFFYKRAHCIIKQKSSIKRNHWKYIEKTNSEIKPENPIYYIYKNPKNIIW